MSGNQPPASQAAESTPDPEALFATRLEAERRAITAQARQDAEREIQRARAQIACAVEQFAQQREEYFRRAEGEVVSLALAIARRLLHRETQIDPRLLAGLVNYELDQLDAATSVRLLVSPETLSYWNAAAPTMSRPVEVGPDKALAAGAVRIETVLGSTMVSFERELKEIERGFFDLLSHRPTVQETTTAHVQ
jgi:flagellar assembly protein FliH